MMWDPVQYGRFARERGRPFLELLNRVELDAPRRIVDLGCGAGNLTTVLADRWPTAIIEGIDSSPEMISSAPAVERITMSPDAVVTTMADVVAARSRG